MFAKRLQNTDLKVLFSHKPKLQIILAINFGLLWLCCFLTASRFLRVVSNPSVSSVEVHLSPALFVYHFHFCPFDLNFSMRDKFMFDSLQSNAPFLWLLQSCGCLCLWMTCFSFQVLHVLFHLFCSSFLLQPNWTQVSPETRQVQNSPPPI